MSKNIDESMEDTLKSIQEGNAEEEIEEIEEITDEVADEQVDETEESAIEEQTDDVVEEELSAEDETEEVVAETVTEEEPEIQLDAGHVNPPSTWRAEAKSKWANIDPAIKAEIHKREGDAMRGAEMLKDDANFGKQISSVVAPYMPTIRAKGATETEAIETMLNAYHVLETAAPQEKAQQLLATAQQYGVLNEIGALLQNQVPTQPQGLTPEQVSQQIAAERQAWESQQTTQSIQSEVEQFASASNEDGTLRHPYFENVRATMGALVQADSSLSIEDAYERAIWAAPDIRAILESQQAGSVSQSQEQAKTHAEKAKKASQNNLRKKPSHAVKQPAPTGSVDDTMQEALENMKAQA